MQGQQIPEGNWWNEYLEKDPNVMSRSPVLLPSPSPSPKSSPQTTKRKTIKRKKEKANNLGPKKVGGKSHTRKNKKKNKKNKKIDGRGKK